MMVRKFFVLSLIALLTNETRSQSVEFEKSNFPGRKEEFREALKKLDAGMELFDAGRREVEDFRKMYLVGRKYYPVSVYDYSKTGYENFRMAQLPLTDAHRFNPDNAGVNYMLGVIAFNMKPAGKEAIQFLEKAVSLNMAAMEPDVHYWLGWAYHLNGKWEEAIKSYQRFEAVLMQKGRANAAAIEDVRKKIRECDAGKKLSAKPERVFVDNLGPNINTSFPEYGPSITTDEETILFTARRPNSIGGKRDEADNGFYEDVYTATKVNGKWQPSKQVSKNVNTDGHDASAGLSPDGSKLYVYRHSGFDGGDLYESVLFGLDWEVPIHMNRNINTKYHESSVSLSFDGKRLYFVSDKESGYGDRDIYYSELDVNGEWGPSKNLGPEVNTKYGEEAVFMHPDGVTLYFSSKGHGTMGGYDIFKTTNINGKWSTPINLGYPINGPDDDVFFVVSGSGNRAYFASSKQDGYGEKDIYKITFLGPEKPPLLNTQDQLISAFPDPVTNLKTETPLEMETSKLTLLKGVVSDEKTQKPLESIIELVDNEKNEVLATFKSNKISGKYLVTLPSGHNYGIAVKCPGYLFHSENFLIPQTADFQEFSLDIALKRLDIGSSVVLRNIFYDVDKSTIRPESEFELTRLVKLLKDNETVRVEIGSFTDNVGTEEYNLKLSDSRSKAVVDYLVSKGIPATRLTSKGYGESKAIATNDTEAGRQKNRRTEFKIISK
jgi:outer membrane protein OmpA-like peptidoglycan-associated protein